MDARAEADKLIDGINFSLTVLRGMKVARPELMCGVRPNCVGSILNGYREGDLAFDEAVRMLQPSGISPERTTDGDGD